MKHALFVVAGFAGGAFLANQFYSTGYWWLTGGLLGAGLGWVFSGVGEPR